MAANLEAQFWRLAESDLAAAERLSGVDPLVEPALFHCQQAAEKALKSLIVHGGGTPPQSHDLLLLAQLSGLPANASVDADLALLTQYAVAPRYPLATRPYDLNELAPAVAAARRMLERIRVARGNP